MYWQEIRPNARTLLAACVGMGLGSALSHYTMSLFGPALIAEFGWSRADYALIGTLPLVNLFLIPFAGWFVDRAGTRFAAAIGFGALCLGFVALGLMNGNIVVFFTIWLLQSMFAGLASSLVFCRVVVEKFDRARGLALSVAMTASPLGGAIAAPLLGGLIDAEGWRAGYFALALVCGSGGVLAISLLGGGASPQTRPAEASGLSAAQILDILRNPKLILLLAGMLLVNIPQVFASSQLKLIALDSGVSGEAATWMISLYAGGVIVGRFICGLALDRVEPWLVALVSLGLPAMGYLIFASPVTAMPWLVFAVMTIGLAQGAEGDLGAYIIARSFDLRNFSLLLGFMTAALGAGSAIGSIILSITLRSSGGYEPYLVVSAVATLIGAALFALTRQNKAVSAA